MRKGRYYYVHIFPLQEKNSFLISGDTFDIKDAIKGIGGRWDGPSKSWMVKDMEYEDIFHIVEKELEKHYAWTNHCKFCNNCSPTFGTCTLEVRRYDPSRHKLFETCECDRYPPWVNCPLCSFACCEKATRKECVGEVCFTCAEHGNRCYGNHE